MHYICVNHIYITLHYLESPILGNTFFLPITWLTFLISIGQLQHS